MEKIENSISLIYFDSAQYKDYLEDEVYNEAYNKILEEKPIFIWTGEVVEKIEKHYTLSNLEKISNTEIIIKVYNEHGDEFKVDFFNVKKILVRGRNIPDFSNHTTCINSPTLNKIINNKKLTKDFIKTLGNLSDTVSDNVRVLKKNTKYVVKPVDGLKGEGILISSDHDEILKYERELIQKGTEYLIEPFIEGIPFKGHNKYDIRVVFVGGKPVLSMLRIPKEGSELANLAQGGSKELISIQELPKFAFMKLLELNQAIKSIYGKSVFSVDFNITENSINIFELNSYPGIRPEYDEYIENLSYLLDPKNIRSKRVSSFKSIVPTLNTNGW